VRDGITRFHSQLSIINSANLKCLIPATARARQRGGASFLSSSRFEGEPPAHLLVSLQHTHPLHASAHGGGRYLCSCSANVAIRTPSTTATIWTIPSTSTANKRTLSIGCIPIHSRNFTFPLLAHRRIYALFYNIFRGHLGEDAESVWTHTS
jgi:hypothetical protein